MPEVLQLCPNDHPPFLSICRNHAKSLASLGFDVDTVFFESRSPNRDAEARYLDVVSWRDAIARLRPLAAAKPYRLVLTHRYKGYLAGQAVRPADAQQIAVAHEFGMFDSVRRRWRQRLRGRATVFAGVSAPVADELKRRQLKDASVEVLPNSIDVGAVAPLAREEARIRLGLPVAATIVGVVGRLHPKKRPALALDGFIRALDQLPANTWLVMVGAGPLAGSLAASLESVGASAASRIQLAGEVPAAGQLMKAFDLLLVPSGPREAFGMTLIEAALAGTPVLCADWPGPRSVLGELGEYFQGDDPARLAGRLCETVTNLAAITPRMAAGGPQRVAEGFSLEALARRFRCLLRLGPS